MSIWNPLNICWLANHYLLSVGCVLFSPFPTSKLISIIRASHKNLLMEPIYNSCSLSSPRSFLTFGNLLMLFFFANSSLESQQSLFLTCFTFLNSRLWPSFFSFWEDDLTSHFAEKKNKIMWFDISHRVPCGFGSCYSLVNANLSFPPGSCLITSLATMYCFLTCSFTEKLNNFPIFI